MSTIIIERIVECDDYKRNINVQVLKVGCLVSMLGGTIGPLQVDTPISWEDMDNVELLAETFANETVRVFKALVELLGKVYANKDVYMALA